MIMRLSLSLMTMASMMIVSSFGFAQSGSITADPNAQLLRKIWQVNGKPFIGGDRVGEDVVGLGDIYGTGKGAWGVYYGTLHQSRIFRNDSMDIAKDTAPVQVFDSLIASLAGDFWGTGHAAVGFAYTNLDRSGPRTKYYYELHIHRTEANRIADNASVMFNGRLQPLKYEDFPDEVLAADLDEDGADELIMTWAGTVADTGLSPYPEIWIYKGGPGFQLDSPTVIVRHPILNGQVGVFAAIGDFDGDHHADIAMSRSYTDTRNHLTFYWGTGNVADFGRPENTRVIPLTDSMPDARWRITGLDCDGDGVMDLAMDRGRGQPARQGVYLFRSLGSRNARTRSFLMSEADQWFPGTTTHARGGYMNDSGRQYDMLTIIQFGADLADPSTVRLFSGGPNGPDLAYDADATSSAITLYEPMFDADGDGWDDLLVGNYAVDHEGGAAVMYAGGPYIPGPGTSGVDAIVGEGHDQSIALWPNPMRDELHIAWRGDLRRMPSRFVVHDLLGNEVARGAVESWRGTAIWNCSPAAPGIYLLSVYDGHEKLIATTRIVKEST